MSEAYLGEIRILAGRTIPQGWLMCNGQALNLSQYAALFALIGTQYGGNGQTTFNLPNLQAMVVVGAGSGPGLQAYTLGQNAGVWSVTVTEPQCPAHTHPLTATNVPATTTSPVNALPAQVPSGFVAWVPPTPPPTGTPQLDPALLTSVGGNAAHSNMMPTVAFNYIICVNGIFPDFS